MGSKYRCEWIFTKERQGDWGGGSGIDVNGSLPKRGKGAGEELGGGRGGTGIVVQCTSVHRERFYQPV